MIDGLPLSFFLPGVLPSLAGLTTAITGIVAFSAPKRRGRHDRWGTCSLWAYTVVFLTATILSLLPGSNRLWLRSGRLRGTTLSAGTTHEARVWEAVGRCSYCRGDWVLRRSVDGLFRGQRPPDSGFEPASTTRVLGTPHGHRAPGPFDIPLSFCTETHHGCASRESSERRQMMARIEGIKRGGSLLTRLIFSSRRRTSNQRGEKNR